MSIQDADREDAEQRPPHLPTHARFAYPDAGYEAEIAQAARHLTAGEVYTIRRLEVLRSESWVELYEVPGVRFGAAMFAPADPDGAA